MKYFTKFYYLKYSIQRDTIYLPDKKKFFLPNLIFQGDYTTTVSCRKKVVSIIVIVTVENSIINHVTNAGITYWSISTATHEEKRFESRCRAKNLYAKVTYWLLLLTLAKSPATSFKQQQIILQILYTPSTIMTYCQISQVQLMFCNINCLYSI